MRATVRMPRINGWNLVARCAMETQQPPAPEGAAI
jgi:hypothetical protein